MRLRIKRRDGGTSDPPVEGQTAREDDSRAAREERNSLFFFTAAREIYREVW